MPEGERTIRTIPAVAIEFNEGGNTLWVHGLGGTVLRIKTLDGKITTTACKNSPTSHADLVVTGDIEFCLGPDEGKDVLDELQKLHDGMPG